MKKLKNFLKIKHLEEKNMGYWEHWFVAITCSAVLFIHAWLPFLLEDYVSKKITKK